MKCTNYCELPFEKLFEIAQQKYESLEYEEAEYFYELAYEKDPHNEMLILCYCNLLKSIQKPDKAKIILEKSIQHSPAGTYKRFFQLAEIYQGVQSIKVFQTGITQAIKCLQNPFKSTTPEHQIKRDIAQAYASIAEVCMTDLLNQVQAEPKCIEALQKGKKIDQKCLDVRVQIANYLMFKDKFEEARVELVFIYNCITQKHEEYQSQLIMNAAKYLIEVEEYKKAQELFERLHEDQSNESEVIYMLAFVAYKQEKYDVCDDFMEEYDQAQQNNELVDQEIQEAVKELKAELNKRKKKENQETGEGEDQWMDVEDEDEAEGNSSQEGN